MSFFSKAKDSCLPLFKREESSAHLRDDSDSDLTIKHANNGRITQSLEVLEFIRCRSYEDQARSERCRVLEVFNSISYSFCEVLERAEGKTPSDLFENVRSSMSVDQGHPFMLGVIRKLEIKPIMSFLSPLLESPDFYFTAASCQFFKRVMIYTNMNDLYREFPRQKEMLSKILNDMMRHDDIKKFSEILEQTPFTRIYV
jgi:hypothetical protein